ncbi:MAG: hypothetical protein J1E57_11320 [Prevotella sp.]|nr:hypothetical protein [Prevotella sp.]
MIKIVGDTKTNLAQQLEAKLIGVQLENLNIIPPNNIIEQWRKDYENMRRYMIYGDSAGFDDLIYELKKFNQKVNNYFK